MNISKRIAVFHEGEIIAVGVPEKIQQNEMVRKIYLGQGKK